MPIPLLGAAAITGGASFLGGLVNGIFNNAAGNQTLQAQREANETNIRLANEQMAWNERMWNMQNEYNTPAQQMQRISEAGLNPNLMYSQGSPGVAGSVSSYNRANVEPETGKAQALSRLGSIIQNTASQIGNTILDQMFKMEQIKQLREQSKLLAIRGIKEANTTPTLETFQNYYQERIRNLGASTQYLDSRTAGQDIQNIYQPGILGSQQRHTEIQNTALNQSMAIQYCNLALATMNYQLRSKLTNAQVYSLYAGANYAIAKTDALDKLQPHQLESAIQDAAIKGSEASIAQKTDDAFWFKLILDALGTASKFMPK